VPSAWALRPVALSVRMLTWKAPLATPMTSQSYGPKTLWSPAMRRSPSHLTESELRANRLGARDMRSAAERWGQDS